MQALPVPIVTGRWEKGPIHHRGDGGLGQKGSPWKTQAGHYAASPDLIGPEETSPPAVTPLRTGATSNSGQTLKQTARAEGGMPHLAFRSP